MSDDVLSIIPTDPYWQPGQADGEHAAALVAAMTGVTADAEGVWMDVTWHDTVTVVDCGQNLERIGCPHCGASIDSEWWLARVDASWEDGFATLAVRVPCCDAATSLDALDYRWPFGFARFQIAVWNPQRDWLSEEELAAVAGALGRPVRQVRAHI